MNPIFIEYYSHEKCECYKINNPWTKYAQEKIVLCRVDEGYEMAKQKALEVINTLLEEVLTKPIKNPRDDN